MFRFPARAALRRAACMGAVIAFAAVFIAGCDSETFASRQAVSGVVSVAGKPLPRRERFGITTGDENDCEGGNSPHTRGAAKRRAGRETKHGEFSCGGGNERRVESAN